MLKVLFLCSPSCCCAGIPSLSLFQTQKAKQQIGLLHHKRSRLYISAPFAPPPVCRCSTVCQGTSGGVVGLTMPLCAGFYAVNAPKPALERLHSMDTQFETFTSQKNSGNWMILCVQHTKVCSAYTNNAKRKEAESQRNTRIRWFLFFGELQTWLKGHTDDDTESQQMKLSFIHFAIKELS